MANKKWIQSARRKMERKGTVGAFTEYCGGRVTSNCIDRALKSNNPTLQRRAQFAKNMRNLQAGGPAQPISPLAAQPIQAPQQPTPQLQTGAPSAGPAVDAASGAAGAAAGASPVGAISQVAEVGGQAIIDNSDKTGGKVAGGALKGAGKGAAMGASIGTMILPGIGTAIGAGIGALAGGIAGGVKQKKAADAENKAELDAKEAQLMQQIQPQQSKYGSFTKYYEGGLRYQPGNFKDPPSPVAAPDVQDQSLAATFQRMGAAGQLTEAQTIERQIEEAKAAGDMARVQGLVQMHRRSTGMMKMGGAKDLPGGVQMPIGRGVDKFVGNKHDQAGNGSDSGIILEKGGKGKPGVEVEDGELMAKVKTTKGKKEYIVSDYIVNPATGNTLAEDMEREIKAAKSQKQADQIKQKYVKLNEELKDDGNPEMVKAQDGEWEGGSLTAKEAKVGEQSAVGGGKFGEATDDSLEAMKARNPWYDFEAEGFDPNDSASVLKFQKEYNKRAPEGKQIVEDGKYGTQTDSVRLHQPTKPLKGLGIPTVARPPQELKGEIKPIEPGVPTEGPEEPETPQEQPAEEGPQGSINLRPTGTMLQALGPAYALTQSMVPKKVRPEYIKAPRLGRVNYDRERAEERGAAAATGEAASRSMAGPAAFAARQSTAAQSASRQRGITDAETRANMEIANREKGMEMGASQFNANAFMGADRINAAAVNRARETNMENRIAAVNQLGRIGTQTVKDYNQQRADIFEGQASQVDGEFDRALQNYYKGPKVGLWGKANINPQGGTTMSQQQIDAMYAQQNAEEQPTEGARRGRYVKRPGKINRRSRRR